MMKTKQDIDMINHISVVYAENETELLSSIGSDAIHYGNKRG